MRGARPRREGPGPEAGGLPAAADEEQDQLERRLQQQLQDDVARIFDESIFSDVEVVCGKQNILTHSCILKTRANNFYQKLESILKHNISRNSFDEVYSFISDAYTECDIKHQEEEILQYLNKITKSDQLKPTEDNSLFLTPKGLTPNTQETSQYVITATNSDNPNQNQSESYFMPVETRVLERELDEQDALSNAFQTLSLNQTDEDKITASHTKPTTLSLVSSLCSESAENSNRCDIYQCSNARKETNGVNNSNFDNLTTTKGNVHANDSCNSETLVGRSQNQAYSPDSLITDDPSSSSDYLSAAYPLSPGEIVSGGITQLNVSASSSLKMEDKNSLDSGLERSYPSDLSRSHGSNRDVTLTDVSLTESTLQDLTMDDTHASMSGSNNIPPVSNTAGCISGTHYNAPPVSHAPASIPGANNAAAESQRSPMNAESASSSEGSNVPFYLSTGGTRPTKAEKQRQNQEIHVMESSSLSSEAGSWESVFPPRQAESVICVNVVNGECQQPNQADAEGTDQGDGGKRRKFKYVSPFVKSAACFIDASSLMDDTEENTIKIWPSDKPQAVEKIVDPQGQTQDPLKAESASQVMGTHAVESRSQQSPCSTSETAPRAVRSYAVEQPTQLSEYATQALCAQSPSSRDRPMTFSRESSPRPVHRLTESPRTSIFSTPQPASQPQPSEQPMPTSKHKVSLQATGPRAVDSSKPLPCRNARWHEKSDESDSDESDDSLEKVEDSNGSYEKRNSLEKWLYPEIFDMTPVSESATKINANNTNSIENTRNTLIEERQKTEQGSHRGSIHEERSLQFPQEFVLANTPHNSILTIKATAAKSYESEDNESDSTLVGKECGNCAKSKKYNESSPIVSGGASIEDHLPFTATSPLIKRKIENIPIVSGAYTPPVEQNNPRKAPKASCVPAWVVDMGNTQQDDVKSSPSSVATAKKPGDKQCDNIKNESKHYSLENGNKSRGSVDSDSSERSSHKFYVDLSSLPDPIPPKNNENEVKEKKNIFSMYIGLDENTSVKKEMPARLSTSLNARKSTGAEPKRKEKKEKEKQRKEAPNANTHNTRPKKNEEGADACFFETVESLCSDPRINMSDILKYEEFSELARKSMARSAHEVPAIWYSMDPETADINPGIPSGESDAYVDPETGNVVNPEPGNFLNREPGNFVNPETGNFLNREPGNVVNPETGDFVRLSDLDRPVPRADCRSESRAQRQPRSNASASDARMSRSIPENNPAGTRTLYDVISSFHSENATSLNRLFPNLRNEFSRSMPGSLAGRNSSPVRLSEAAEFVEDIFPGERSDTSEASSAQSSMCPSAAGQGVSTEETSQTSSLIDVCQSRLGQDLLRMFLEEVAPDVVVEVAGRRIKAHKCILSSRCQYFAGILSGGWVESAGNIIVLPPFTYNVIHFAMCHIYSGVSVIPDSISILELVTVADMLGLEGLKEAITFTLKSKYCHHFHKPCTVCIAGVMECFPLTSIYGLDELCRRCLRWITKHWSQVWCTQAFATLPRDLLDRCFQELVNSFTVENIVDNVCVSGFSTMQLQSRGRGRWAETVLRLCRRVVNAAASFAAPRLPAVLRRAVGVPSDMPRPAMDAFRDCIAAAIEWAPPDAACEAYAYLHSVVQAMRTQRPDLIRGQNRALQPDLLETFAPQFTQQCEGALVRAAPRVVGTAAFAGLPPELRRRLRELGCIVYGAPLPPSPGPERRRSARARPDSASHGDIEQVRACFVPYAPKPPVPSADIIKINNDVRAALNANRPLIRTTKAQEERAKYNLSKNQSQELLNNGNVRASLSRSYGNAKPRYMEPKATLSKAQNLKQSPGQGTRISGAVKNRFGLPLSSNESSRNTSPVLRGRARIPPAPPRPAESTDSRSDSQGSNKYATYTKTKSKHSADNSTDTSKSVNSNQSQGAIRKVYVTKIPVYSSQAAKSVSGAKPKDNREKRRSEPPATINTTNGTNGSPRARRPNSLMSATKSSSAKMVPKITKETTKPLQKKRTPKREDPPGGLHVMERSGTFLKDEPTFGNQNRFDVDSETE